MAEVAVVAVVAVSALPLSAAETVVVVNKPDDGLNFSLVDDNFGGRLPVLAVTHNGYMVALVVESSVTATLVALVEVPANAVAVTVPFTSNAVAGVSVPMPTLPPGIMEKRRAQAVPLYSSI